MVFKVYHFRVQHAFSLTCQLPLFSCHCLEKVFALRIKEFVTSSIYHYEKIPKTIFDAKSNITDVILRESEIC